MRCLGRWWGALGGAFALATAAAPAQAQVAEPRPSDGVVVPWRSLAATDDASSIAVNPANIAWGPAPEARATVVWTPPEAPLPLRGYSLDLALPFWFLGTGLRIDWMEPSRQSPAPYAVGGAGQRYAWVRWGNSIALGDVAAIGTTFAWSKSDVPALHDFFSVTSGLTLRTNRFVSAAVVARDWNSPDSAGGTELKPSVDFGAVARPLDGARDLEIGLEASYRSLDQSWVPSANAAVDIPYLGRFRAGAQLLDPSSAQVVISAGLDINLDRLQVSGGLLYGSALGVDGTGFVAGAAIRGFDDATAVPQPAQIVRLRIESGMGNRAHTSLLRGLWHMADNDEVAGVLFELRASPASSLAHAEEIVDAIRLLRARGKKVFCHLEDAGGRELFLCSAANAIAINPAGGIRFAGLSARTFYLGGLMDKLGVRADFVRIGRHKGAPEQFTDGPTPVRRADQADLLAQYQSIYTRQLARGRGMTPAEAAETIAKGPFIAPEALSAGLVDQLVYEDEIPRFVRERMGYAVSIRDGENPTVAPKTWRTPPRIAVVYLEGTMIDGKSQTIPFLGLKLSGSYTIAKALKQARQDPTVDAVVLRVESGGGSSLASDVILREASLVAKKKPLIVSMGGAAASGGYYASVAGQAIFANRSTVTGSIGIFYGKADVSQLLDRIGVHVDAVRSAPRADAESLFRPFTDEERLELGRKVKQFYDLFVGRVADGRGMSAADVDAVARGRVWTGQQASTRGLVDHVGGLRQALARARAEAGLDDDAPILELPPPDPTLFEQVLAAAGIPSLTVENQVWLPAQLLEVAHVVAPFTIFAPHEPLALSELFLIDP